MAQNLVNSGALFKGRVTPAKLSDEPPYTAIKPKVLDKLLVAKTMVLLIKA
ncbi:hypothetical protein D3C71_1888950 [compost metagenome]